MGNIHPVTNKKTAKAIAEQKNWTIKPLAYKELMEQNFGLWQSKTWDELDEDPESKSFGTILPAPARLTVKALSPSASVLKNASTIWTANIKGNILSVWPMPEPFAPQQLKP